MKKPNPYLIDDENPELDDEKHIVYQALINAVLRDYVSKCKQNPSS